MWKIDMGFWWRPLGVLASVMLVALILWAGSGPVAALGVSGGHPGLRDAAPAVAGIPPVALAGKPR